MISSIPDFHPRVPIPPPPSPVVITKMSLAIGDVIQGAKSPPAEPLIYSQPHTQLLPHLSTNPHSNPPGHTAIIGISKPPSLPPTTIPFNHPPCTRHISALVSSRPVASRAGRSCHLDPGRRAEMQLGRKWRGRKVGSLGSLPEDHGGGEVIRGSQREWGAWGPRWCGTSGVSFGGTLPTHSEVCSFCCWGVRVPWGPGFLCHHLQVGNEPGLWQNPQTPLAGSWEGGGGAVVALALLPPPSLISRTHSPPPTHPPISPHPISLTYSPHSIPPISPTYSPHPISPI